MDRRDTLQVGVNLGGWLSQYQEYDPQHFKTFITADDIHRIADWGMDHIRLPIDYPVLEDDARPGVYKEDGFVYVDACREWCRANGLQVALDLHKAPGFDFNYPDTVSLFSDPSLQDRFVALWQAIARRYHGENDLIFELLNEIVLPDSALWNALVRRTVAAIRAIDRQRRIVIGGNHYNAVDQLAGLELFDDARIVYTFHFYRPMIVTHQKAPWYAPGRDHNRDVHYPGECPDLDEFLRQNPQHRLDYQPFVGVHLDREWLRAALQPAVEFVRRTGRPVYCGEYGVIDRAPLPSRLNWCRDVVDALNEFGIGRACWSYKEMDFGLVDHNGQAVSQALIKIVSSR